MFCHKQAGWFSESLGFSFLVCGVGTTPLRCCCSTQGGQSFHRPQLGNSCKLGL